MPEKSLYNYPYKHFLRERYGAPEHPGVKAMRLALEGLEQDKSEFTTFSPEMKRARLAFLSYDLAEDLARRELGRGDSEGAIGDYEIFLLRNAFYKNLPDMLPYLPEAVLLYRTGGGVGLSYKIGGVGFQDQLYARAGYYLPGTDERYTYKSELPLMFNLRETEEPQGLSDPQSPNFIGFSKLREKRTEFGYLHKIIYEPEPRVSHQGAEELSKDEIRFIVKFAEDQAANGQQTKGFRQDETAVAEAVKALRLEKQALYGPLLEKRVVRLQEAIEDVIKPKRMPLLTKVNRVEDLYYFPRERQIKRIGMRELLLSFFKKGQDAPREFWSDPRSVSLIVSGLLELLPEDVRKRVEYGYSWEDKTTAA